MRPASIWNLISSSASAADCASSAEVGSSSSSTRGSSAMARTSPRRWRSPVESSATGRSRMAGCSASGESSRSSLAVAAKVLARDRAPPGRLGRRIAHAPAPLGARHLARAPRLRGDVARRRIEIGDGAQQAGLAGARGALDGQAFVRRHLEGERRQPRHPQIVDPQHRQPPPPAPRSHVLSKGSAEPHYGNGAPNRPQSCSCQRLLRRRRRRQASQAHRCDQMPWPSTSRSSSSTASLAPDQ